MSGPITFSDEDDYSMELPDVGGEDNENGSVDDPFGRIQKNLSTNKGIGATTAQDADWKMSDGSDAGSTGNKSSSSRRKTPAGPAKQFAGTGRKSSGNVSYKDDDLDSLSDEDQEQDDNYVGSDDPSDDDFEASTTTTKRTPRRGGNKGGSKGGRGAKSKARSGGRAKSKSGGGGRGSRAAAKAAKKVIEEVILDDEEEDYEIEEILDKKIERGKVIYYLSWKGFDSSHNSWEPMENLNCPELIEVYEAKQRAKKGSPGASGANKPKYRPGPASRTKKREASPTNDYLNNDDDDDIVGTKKAKVGNGGDTQSDEDIENVNFEADDFQSYDDDTSAVVAGKGKVIEDSDLPEVPEDSAEKASEPVVAGSNVEIQKTAAAVSSKMPGKSGSPECLHCSKRIYQGIYRKKYSLSSKLNVQASLNVYEGLTQFYTHYKGAYPLVSLEPIIHPPEKETRFICNNCAELVENFCNSLFRLTEVSSSTSAISLMVGDLEEEKEDWLGIADPNDDDDGVVGGSGQVTSAAKKFYPEDNLKEVK